MINLKNLRKRYQNGHDALRGINLNIERGELVFLTGHSGAGKSTILKLVGLLEQPSSGMLTVDNTDLSSLSSKQIPFYRRKIGMIFQNPTLLNDRSVYDNLALPLDIAGFSEEESRSRIHASLELVGLLKKQNQFPLALSGGEQQRVGIARAIVCRPDIILADEPTGNLDPELSKDIMNLFVRLNQVGITLVIATHDLALISSLNFRQIRLKDGKVIDESSSEQVTTKTETQAV
ncbi:MAG: cell division ATP-binding protein FtsE [Gammaproteobacteria bacterium]|nr:cell division ATP-binding protein FtsE [Gammaproteobacteria bacterium]